MNKWTARRMTAIAMLTAAALLIYLIEAQFPPPVAIPGVKLGLANIITLVALYLLGWRDALLTLLLRISLGSVFAGQAISFLYSLAGGLACFALMLALKGLLGRGQMWAVSALGAIAHNCAQILVAALLAGAWALLWYLPALLISGVISGLFTGWAAGYALGRLERAGLRKDNNKPGYLP